MKTTKARFGEDRIGLSVCADFIELEDKAGGESREFAKCCDSSLLANLDTSRMLMDGYVYVKLSPGSTIPPAESPHDRAQSSIYRFDSHGTVLPGSVCAS